MNELYSDLKMNSQKISNDFLDCTDFLIRDVISCNQKCFYCLFDGLVDFIEVNQLVTTPMLDCKESFSNPQKFYNALKSRILKSVEIKEISTFSDCYTYLASGFILIFIDGCNKAIAIGVQGWTKRDTSEPTNESVVKGSKECFLETLNDNRALLRKRLKTNHLKFKQLSLGKASKTIVAIAYIDNRVNTNFLNKIEKELKNEKLNTVLDFGCLNPVVDTNLKSFFSTVVTTERPDVLVSKLLEGRVGIIVDGTPFVMYTPGLFSDAFSSLDDYNYPPFYASFIRVLRYLSFFISLFLPGIYVAIGTFHQELIPTNLLFVVASSEATTPFTLMTEAVLIHILYEIMREAGLRLPKAIGHAVSIIGAIVIGDATVSAGIIGAPMLVIVAITAISSYVVYPMFESVAVLRILFIFVGGLTGIYGIMLGMGMLFVNVCTLNPYGVAYSSPFSPITKNSIGDTLYRESWSKLSKRKVRIFDLEGSTLD